ncbi:sugar ABC transporter permease [Leptolyngbya sp. FACHB-541]|uniref:sugar ABC transporter permease n=1 Tax=Leptolyngbya sp. FACHB-541 TaxID=2692810 RepID=UPI0016867086|nr:sugar ABC transporter permease [Leptolyngbya sp. FACHB-541]MBD1996724.1 sugar ABC transporter permease [Leptolyngbya sp. FACHB-541]
MTDLKMTIALQDPELEDEELQDYTQNLLPQIREFDGVEEAGLVPRDQPVEVSGMTSKDFGAVLLGTVTVISTLKALIEIIDWVEKRWLKSKANELNRKLSIEVTTPDGYKLAITAEDLEDLNAFRAQIIKQLGEG